MGHIFSKKKSHVTEQDKAILQLKTTRDKIRQYQKRSEAQLNKDRELAKLLLQAHKKERAKLLLRKKRLIEGQLQKTDGQLENVEKMIQDLEFAQIEIKVVDSLKVGNDALKEVNKLLNIEDIERMLDETKEGAEKQEEISALLCGLAAEAGISEDELESELAALVAQELPDVEDEQLPPATEDISVPTLPDVPQGEVAAASPSKSTSKKIAVAAS